MWRLPVAFRLASEEFELKMPEMYASQWHEKYNFSNYLIFSDEKKYILPKADNINWNFLSLQINNKDFKNKLTNDVLFMLFYFGTDFPGLVKKFVSFQ